MLALSPRGLLVFAFLALAGVPAAAAQDQIALGREVFLERAQPQCGICHALADAGTAGSIGPDLDDVAPTAEQVERVARSGIEAMPSFAEVLSAEEIAAVAAYVASVTGQ